METQGLSAICTSLGIIEEDKYGNVIAFTKDEYCLENLKDLLRFVRRDDPQTRDVFKQVCKWKITSKYLVPILRYCQEDRNLVLNTVKVLVFLTMPIDTSSCDFIEQTEHLWSLKSALTNEEVFAVIVPLLVGPLKKLQDDSLKEEDWKVVQLLMTLFRNLLAIQDVSSVKKSRESAFRFLSLRDKFLELLFKENVMDIILVITENIGGVHCYFRQDNLLLLEILYLTVMGQEPKMIADAGFHDKKDTSASIDKLESIIKEEQEKRRLLMKQNINRHSNFGGTFSRLSLNGTKTLCQGIPNTSSRNVLLRRHKAPKSVKKLVKDAIGIPITEGNLLRSLNDFLNQFLSGCYNVLMQSVRDDIENETQEIESSDVVVFFNLAHFIMSFQYHKTILSKDNSSESSLFEEINDQTMFNGDICGPIAATMNESMFQFVHSKWRYAFDGLKVTHDYRFLSASGALMKIMIQMLDLVVRLSREGYNEAQTARALLYKIFYDQTDQGLTHFLLNSIRSFDTIKQPKSHLADLLETIHLMLRLIETLQARGTLRVSRKSRNARKKKLVSSQEESRKDSNDEEQSEKNLAALPEETIAPTSLNKPNHNTTQGDSSPAKDSLDNNMENDMDIEDDISSSTGELSGDEQPSTTHEVDFKASSFLSSFATHSIVKNMCWLLGFYKSNSHNINSYIISLLKRITEDMDLSPMLYQLSLLTTFYDVLEEQKISLSPEHAEIVDFLKDLVRKMMHKMKKRPFLFVEILFWKTKRECHCINADHLLHQLKNMKKDASSSFPASEDGDLEKFNKKTWVPRNLADALGDDEADVVIPHYQPHNTDEDDELNQPEEAPRRKKRLVLTEEVGLKIKELHEKFKDSENCCREIAQCMSADFEVTPQQILNKLKHLHLSIPSKKTARRVPNVDLNHTPADALLEEDLNFLNKISGQKSRSKLKKLDEETIRILFEQFKDSKRCHQLIADALSSDMPVNSAQVARKLVKLGLKTSKKRKSISEQMETTEEQSSLLRESYHIQIQNDDVSCEETEESNIKERKHLNEETDYDTIDSVKKYSKMQKDKDSGDKTVVSFAKKTLRKQKSERTENQSINSHATKIKPNEKSEDSDDEIIGSLDKKTSQGKTDDDTDDEHIGTLVKKNPKKPTSEDSDDEIIVSFIKKKFQKQKADSPDGIIVPDKKKLKRQKGGRDLACSSQSTAPKPNDEDSDDEIIGSLVNKTRNLKWKTAPNEDPPSVTDSFRELADSENDAAPPELGDSQPRCRKRRLVFDDDA